MAAVMELDPAQVNAIADLATAAGRTAERMRCLSLIEEARCRVEPSGAAIVLALLADLVKSGREPGADGAQEVVKCTNR